MSVMRVRNELIGLMLGMTLVSCSTPPADDRSPSLTREACIEMFARSFAPGRSGDVFVVPEEGDFLLSRADTTFYRFMHGSPWSYDTRIPLLLYGAGAVNRGTFDAPAGQQDIAPTMLSLLPTTIPDTMTGRVLTEALQSNREPPAAVVVVVLDGLGADSWDRLGRELPHLSRLRREGAWFRNARVDYAPSVTAAGHATVATGADPRVHGVVANSTFDRSTGEWDRPFAGMDPTTYPVLTLSDHWDIASSGRAVILTQGTTERATVALAGHGACTARGSRTVMAMYDQVQGMWTTNDACFRLPEYLDELDVSELWEAASTSWMGRRVESGKELMRTGLFPEIQADALLAMIEWESVGADSITDLVLVSFKTPDYVSHRYGPTSAEADESLRDLDRQFGRIVDGLDRLVGGGRWVLAITADHGMAPEPATSGTDRRFVDDMVDRVHGAWDPEGRLVLGFGASAHQIWLDHPRLEQLGVAVEEVAAQLEALPYVRFALTEEEIRASRPR